MNSPGRPQKKKGSSKTSRTTESYESPLITAEDNNPKNMPMNDPDEEQNNSQLSDSSDVCIIECPPSLIEINDTLDVVSARKSKEEKNVHVSPEKSITLKRKTDNDEDCIKVDGNTSDETDIDTTPHAVVPKKKRKTVEKRVDEIRTDPQGDDSDEIDVHVPRRRIYQVVGQQKNVIRFDSTDEEDSPPTKSNMERKVMGFLSLGEMKTELTIFCLICEDYNPMFKKHVYTHQLPRKQVSCSNCSRKFYKMSMLKRHRRCCEAKKQ